ncbi:hypothetical protein [Stenotrophomonas maltophilia]|uniref:hypothetical protein n=1 Tax=Stenotrophomonas maltophilia TaxID=40324 RepID=UPI0015DF3B46|nr:hypothetical protein [Stenotrophomonas maltophilia]MBA0447272.1 hypothetical protein [Stenotrophomonas maltophilia]
MRRLIWLALVLLPGTAMAEEGVIYRCTNGSSDVPTLQRTPCPTGSKQQVLRVPALDSSQPAGVEPSPVQDPVPAVVSGPTGPVTPPATTTAPRRADEGRTIMEAGMVEAEGGNQILDSAALRRDADTHAASDGPPKPPLPPIFQCTDNQGGGYLHEYEAAPDRCELMTVQGLGGVTPVNAASCEVVRDRCEELPEAQRCGSWQQRFRDARGRERFAAPENREHAQGERERLQGVLEASNCPVPG